MSKCENCPAEWGKRFEKALERIKGEKLAKGNNDG